MVTIGKFKLHYAWVVLFAACMLKSGSPPVDRLQGKRDLACYHTGVSGTAAAPKR